MRPILMQVPLVIGLVTILGISSLSSEFEKDLLLLSSRAASSRNYPTAGAIANAVNLKHQEYGLSLTVQSRRSSASLMRRIMPGELLLAEVLQARVYKAHKGQGDGMGHPKSDLCSVFNTHAEYITLIVPTDTGITSIKELAGRRVAVGSPGTDLHASVVDILTAVGINYETDLTAIDQRLETFPDLLRDGEVDAFFWPVEKMSRPLAELMSGARKIRAVPIAAAEIDALVAADPFYEKAVVRLTLNTALSQTGLIEALGVKMSLVASCDMPEREVYRVTKATFERLEALRKINPTISLMSFEAMVKNLPSPVHPGAMTYYRESGLNPTLRP